MLKLGQMGTLGVHMKEVLPWLVCWACRAGTIAFCPALAALVSPVQNIIFLTAALFHCISPHRPAIWAGSRAWPPVSVSLIKYIITKTYMNHI
jgi:hypothetical protein